MNIGIREVEGIGILDLRGRLTAGQYSGALRDSIAEFTRQGKDNLLLNMRHVDYVDSSGLGTLVLCFTTIQQRGGALKLVNLSRRQMELMIMTKLSTVFEVFEEEGDAINSFFPGRAIKRFDILEYVKAQAV